MIIWEHKGNVENSECSQMTGVFYDSVIHGLGFICFKIKFLRTQNNMTRLFPCKYGFLTNQSASMQGPIYILNWNIDLPQLDHVSFRMK